MSVTSRQRSHTHRIHSATIRHVPYTDRGMEFFRASQCHAYTVAEQERMRWHLRNEMAIGEMRTPYHGRDWWDAQGPRMRLRAPWRIVKVRLQNAMVRASFTVSRLRGWA